MSAKGAGAAALLIFGIIAFVLWAIFGYTVLIAAFVSTTGALQVALGVYIVGTVLVSVGSMVIKNSIKKNNF